MDGTQLDRDNPWPGLESFEENAQDYFHGRETEAEDLLRRVADAPLTVLFGKSGLGKTSLLKAGLFPRLRARNFLPIHVRLDIRPEAPGLIEQLRDGLLAEIARERVDGPPFAMGETLWEYLHRADLELWNEQNYPLTPVLVLDQFEEVFTLGERLPERVERFKSDLGDLAENRIPAALADRVPVDTAAARLDLRRMGYKLVVTLREDFLPHLEGWRAAVPSLGRVRVRLLPMRPEQALSAVYDTAPHLMDERLARRIVAFVAAAAQGEGAEQQPFDGGEIEPALLSLFCRGLNERRKRQGADRFDEQLLEGAQQSIIADYYRSCIEGLPDSVSRFIESDLITEKGFRNSYAKDDAVPAFLTEEQLDRLINRRLLRVEERYGTARIELTHDLLTRAVMADRDRRRLEEEKAALARRAEEERQKLAMQARTQRRRVAVMAIVALICLALAGIARWQLQEARAAKKASVRATEAAVSAKYAAFAAQKSAMHDRSTAETAQKNAEDERNRARTAESEAQKQAGLANASAAKELIARGNSEARRMETEARLVFDDSGEALVKATLLSVASLRNARTVDGQISLTKFLGLLPKAPRWHKSVAQPVAQDVYVTFGHDPRVLAVSPDGARIATVSESGPVQLLDTRKGQLVGSFEVPRKNGDRTVLAFSPDGMFLVMGCGHQACVIDTVSGKVVTRLPSAEASHGDMVWSASFSPDGKQLAMSSHNSGDVFVYDVATWQKTATILGPVTVSSVAFDPRRGEEEGEWLATGSDLGLQLWRVGHHEKPAATGPDTAIWSIAFQPDSTGLVTAGLGLRSWHIEWGNPMGLEAVTLKDIRAHTVLPVAWHHRPCFVAAASDAVHLLCGESLTEFLRFPVSSLAAAIGPAISPDGISLFNEQNDGMLAAWPLEAGLETHRISLDASVRSIAISEAGHWAAAGTDSGEVAIVSLDSWKQRSRLPLPAVPVDKVTASSDGRWLAVVQGKSLRIFEAGSGREVASKMYAQDVVGAAFVSGDRWLVITTRNTVVVWETSGWRERQPLQDERKIEAVRFSPEGRRLATIIRLPTTGHDFGVQLTRVFDLATRNETGWEYTAPGGSNISQQFAQEEAAHRKQSVAGGDTASAREAASSWPALEIEEPSDRVSADGVWKATFSGYMATLRDVVTNRDIANFDHGGAITCFRFVPAFAPRWLVTAGDDGTLAVWPLRTDDLVREACARLRAMFDPQTLSKLIADAHAEGSCGAN
ncbi:MAG: hypothetical protein QOI58_75 [Thermoanaerobaculia bacterium]|jgi:WD40 repeat protein|nr:hypothetical protein [Thermoanaerobaculia bacterium]